MGKLESGAGAPHGVMLSLGALVWGVPSADALTELRDDDIRVQAAKPSQYREASMKGLKEEYKDNTSLNYSIANNNKDYFSAYSDKIRDFGTDARLALRNRDEQIATLKKSVAEVSLLIIFRNSKY